MKTSSKNGPCIRLLVTTSTSKKWSDPISKFFVIRYNIAAAVPPTTVLPSAPMNAPKVVHRAAAEEILTPYHVQLPRFPTRQGYKLVYQGSGFVFVFVFFFFFFFPPGHYLLKQQSHRWQPCPKRFGTTTGSSSSASCPSSWWPFLLGPLPRPG